MNDRLEGFFDELQSDWFTEEFEIKSFALGYENIADAANMNFSFPGAETEYSEVKESEIENTDKQKIRPERPDSLMLAVFSDVRERLCGVESMVESEYLEDYISELKKDCEVFDTRVSDCTESELRSRVESCLADNGIALLITENGAFSDRQKEATAFLYNGTGTYEIISADSSVMVIKDYTSETGDELQVDIARVISLGGVLLEVLK